MQELITYGFILPPRDGGKWQTVDLTNAELSIEFNVFEDYCKKYLNEASLLPLPNTFSIECSGLSYGLFSSFCIQKLGWCKVGGVFPEKLITLTGAYEFHEKILEYYEKHGYVFNFAPLNGPIF